MNKEICRWCKEYKPDARYQGKLGICKTMDKGTSVIDTCKLFEEGPQEWMQGGKAE